MGARKLTRWQKAGALVPMAVLVGAWGAALTNTGLATAAGGIDGSDIPDVPATAFEQPASVQKDPAGIDPRAGLDGTLQTLSTNGIPTAALSAYRRAELLLAQADPGCNLPWHLVAAIGRVESNHGRIGGNSLNADGVATPGIYGPLLDGKDGRALVRDTDNGVLDRNSDLDRAVGPMQFIPSTWKSVGVDSDNDGTKNPQDIDDAATSAGIYLCAGTGDLSKPADLRAAVLRYNRSASYVDTVLAVSEAYARGDFTQSPNNLTTAAPLVNGSQDQTKSPQDRAKSKNEQKKDEESGSGGNGDGTTPGTTPGTGGGGTPGTPGTPGGGNGGGGTTGGGVSNLVGEVVSGNPQGVLTWADAKAKCIASGLSTLNVTGLLKCITDLLA